MLTNKQTNKQTDRQTGELTGYPSIDKPWLKYYTKEQIELSLPKAKAFDYVVDRNKNNKTYTAINYYNKKITFDEMFNWTEKAAKAFSAIGVTQGDIVAIVSVTLPETIYSFYGLNRIGAISNMIDPRTSIEGIRDYFLEVDASTVITIDLVYERILKAAEGTNIKNVIVISPSDSLPVLLKTLYKLKNKNKINNNHFRWRDFIKLGERQELEETKYEGNTCCTIVHTGGTTGFPKGVMLSDDNINAAAQQILESPLPLSCGDKFLNIMPPFIAYGTVLGIHTVSVGGLESVIIPKFEPSEFDSLLLKYKPQCVMGVPTHFDTIMKSKKMQGIDLSFLKIAFVGGDKIKEEAEKAINNFFAEHNCNIKISKGYSLTEASATSTFASKDCNKEGSVGSPLAKTIVSAFGDSCDDEKPCGEIGNIYISTPTIMIGYYGEKDETSQIIKTDKNGRKWLFTGDLGYIDEDGCVFIMGRAKRMIVRHDGFKVFPSLVEKTINSHSAIQDCCVVGKKDSEHSQGSMPIAFITMKQDVNASFDEVVSDIKSLCNKELPEYAQPIAFKEIKKLPVTPIGKIDYRALEEIINC